MEPENVVSPKKYWRLGEIVYKDSHNEWSAAEGQWEVNGRWEDKLAIRWNGGDGELGNPQSRGLPTWFILPDELVTAVREEIEKLKKQQN